MDHNVPAVPVTEDNPMLAAVKAAIHSGQAPQHQQHQPHPAQQGGEGVPSGSYSPSTAGIPPYPSAQERQAPTGTDTSTLLGQDSFEWKGVVYKLGPVCYDIESQFEQRCYRNELQGIEQMQGSVDSWTYNILLNLWLNRRTAKFWSWKTEACIMARQQEEGIKDLFFFVLEYYNSLNIPANALANRPPVTRKMVEDIWDNHTKWMELKGKIEALSDPNLTAPTPPVKS